MKSWKIILCITSYLCILGSLATGAQNLPLNLKKSGVALEGFDPTSYHTGIPVKGSAKITLNYEGAIYYFSTQENLTIFQEKPEKFVPAFGGWCAWAMLDGQKVKVDPKRFKIVNGKTYLFYNTFFTDTLKKWNTLATKETESSLVKRANEHWQKILSQQI
ncbi:MAG: YHS domain-containing protein [Desulforhopalus sp.]|jgi:YHS domain-containing protein